jgi:hypothetical protein
MEMARHLSELELRNGLRKQELQRQETYDRVEEEKRKATVSCVKRFGDAIKHATLHMLNELVSLFDSLESFMSPLKFQTI